MSATRAIFRAKIYKAVDCTNNTVANTALKKNTSEALYMLGISSYWHSEQQKIDTM